MATVNVIYWSASGNTATMAQSVADGINAAGGTANIVNVSDATVDMIKDAKAVALGCPAMGAEVLEEMEMDPFVSDIEGLLMGKTVGLFGSYGWGDGQWMRDWVERMQAAGAVVVGGEGVICQETPDDTAISECESLGKALASAAN